MKKLVVGLFAAILFISLFYSLMTDEPGQPYESTEQQYSQKQEGTDSEYYREIKDRSIDDLIQSSFSKYESVTYEEDSGVLYTVVVDSKTLAEFDLLNETSDGHNQVNNIKNAFYSSCKRFDANLSDYGHEFDSVKMKLITLDEEEIISFEFTDGAGITTYNRYDKPFEETEPESKPSSSGQYDPAPTNSARHDETTSYIIAQDIVESYLKAPSTANFCRMSECNIQHLGNGEYMVIGWVEAQNSYGAMLRQEFIVTYTATEQGYKNGYCVM